MEKARDILIRSAQAEDMQELASVYTRVYTVFNAGENWTLPAAQRLLDYWFRRNPYLCFTAIYKEQLVGAFFADVKPWWDGYHLVDGEVFVHPEFQSRGIGRLLSIQIYEQALEKYQVISFDTYTFKNNGHPLSWYKKQGFSEINEWVMISGNVRKALEVLKKEQAV